MKFSVTISVILFYSLLSFGCSKETIDPQTSGSIEGQVQDSGTGQGISFASVTTNPGTDAILTDEKGQFTISDIPTGNYTVQAEKKNFKSKTVRVSVTEDQKATAQILLESTDNAPAATFLNARVTNFNTDSRNDSSFVNIEYVVENNSDSKEVPKFEIYFKIYTPKTAYYSEIKGDTLDTGQESIGSFTKYIYQSSSVDSVTVSGVYAPSS